MSSQAGPLGAGRHLFAVPDLVGRQADAAPPGTSALARVRELAASGATGELVCSSARGEIHVFLQRGRVAWASSSRQRRAFTERLKEITGVGDEVIEAVVSECSRTRRPIGEGLIAWNVATAEQVRASLLHQLRTVLASASEDTDARTLFLERAHYRRYDSALTFPLGEVLSSADPGAPVAPRPGEAGGARAGPAGDPAVELARLEGFVAAAVLSAQGERLAVIGDAARLGEVPALTQRLLQQGQRLSIDLGAGLCHDVHLAADEGHLLVFSARRDHLAPGAAGPGVWLRVVLVLRDLRDAARARRLLDALVADLAGVGAG